MRAGERFAAGAGYATALPSLDFETYSEAGYRWVDGRLASLEGITTSRRGLEVVGVRNYVLHPTFEPTLLTFDLLDGHGEHQWVCGNDVDSVCWRLVQHVRSGGLLSAWNVNFEWTVWNFYCTRVWGWPWLDIRQMRCDMAKARAHAWPGSLGEAGPVVQRLLDQRTIPPTAQMMVKGDNYDDDIPF